MSAAHADLTGLTGGLLAALNHNQRLDVVISALIALKPKVVVILAGTNDIARNTGPMTAEMIQHNIMAKMVLGL